MPTGSIIAKTPPFPTAGPHSRSQIKATAIQPAEHTNMSLCTGSTWPAARSPATRDRVGRRAFANFRLHAPAHTRQRVGHAKLPFYHAIIAALSACFILSISFNKREMYHLFTWSHLACVKPTYPHVCFHLHGSRRTQCLFVSSHVYAST